MSPNQHLTELDEITMRFIVNFNDSPGIGSPSDLSSVSGGHDRIGTDDCEWDFALWISYVYSRSKGSLR